MTGSNINALSKKPGGKESRLNRSQYAPNQAMGTINKSCVKTAARERKSQKISFIRSWSDMNYYIIGLLRYAPIEFTTAHRLPHQRAGTSTSGHTQTVSSASVCAILAL